jgi:hypothetical protein
MNDIPGSLSSIRRDSSFMNGSITEFPRVIRLISWGIACLAIIHSATGCRRAVVGRADKTYDRLFWIGEAYMAATDEKDRAPASLEDLLPLLKRHGDPAEIMRSDHDGEDFVVFWNVDYRQYQAEGRPCPVTACERTGRDGRRNVLHMRVISEVTNDQFHALTFPPGQKAPG